MQRSFPTPENEKKIQFGNSVHPIEFQRKIHERDNILTVSLSPDN